MQTLHTRGPLTYMVANPHTYVHVFSLNINGSASLQAVEHCLSVAQKFNNKSAALKIASQVVIYGLFHIYVYIYTIIYNDQAFFLFDELLLHMSDHFGLRAKEFNS